MKMIKTIMAVIVITFLMATVARCQSKYPLMHLTPEEIRETQEKYMNAPAVTYCPAEGTVLSVDPATCKIKVAIKAGECRLPGRELTAKQRSEYNGIRWMPGSCDLKPGNKIECSIVLGLRSQKKPEILSVGYSCPIRTKENE